MKSTIASRFALIGMTTIALGIGVGHASAATPDQDVPKLVVKYQDLDLSQRRDAQRLYRRIQTAAHMVCERHAPESLSGMPQYHACIDRAVNQAVADVSSVEVTQIHDAAAQRVASRG